MSRIIPAIDIIEGKCVRLSKGDYGTAKVYDESPLDVAMSFKDGGIEYLHIVDLDGAKADEPQNLKLIEKIKSKTKLHIDFGGGIKSRQSVIDAFNAGVNQIILGSLAVKQPDLVKSWIDELGADQIIIGADTKDGEIATDGWLESHKKDIFSFINEYISAGAKHFLCTDINKDGMLAGPNIALYKKIMDKCEGVHVIASGGISSMKDVEALEKLEVGAMIIGKAMYEGKIEIADIATIKEEEEDY